MKKHYTPFPAAFVEFGVWGVAIASIILGFIAIRLPRLELDQILNLIEGVFWLAIAFAFLNNRKTARGDQDILMACTISFALFGLSDFIEVFTRAWFQPILLLILKAACVASFLICIYIYSKRKSRREKEAIDHVQDPDKFK